MSQPVRAQDVFRELESPLQLRWIGGLDGSSRVLWLSTEAGGSFFGRLNWVQPPRLQIIGVEEASFLNQLEEPVRDALIQAVLAPAAGALLVCEALEVAYQLQKLADKVNAPLWYTPANPDVVLEHLNHYRHSLDASTVVHGELLEVFGMGVLISGGSGIGKSELALELISRGHRLVADDTPNLTRVAPNVIEGTCPATLHDLLEVRGLGILNIRRMFGDSAIKRNKRVRLVIELIKLEEMQAHAESRLRGMRDHRVILGINVPAITLPIAPGRNLAVLVECAVRDHILRLNGYRAEEDLMARMSKAMAESVPCE